MEMEPGEVRNLRQHLQGEMLAEMFIDVVYDSVDPRDILFSKILTPKLIVALLFLYSCPLFPRRCCNVVTRVLRSVRPQIKDCGRNR